MDPQILSYLNKSTKLTMVGPMPCEPLTGDGPFLFVDGGADKRGKHTGASVGDGDSLKGPTDISIPCEKNYSDLAHALSLVPTQIEEIKLVGFMGGRWDHQLGNFFEALSFLKHKDNTLMNFEDKIHIFSAGSFNFCFAEQFGVFCLEKQKISLTGNVKYPLSEEVELMPMSSHGVSNVSFGAFQITTSGPMILAKGEMKWPM
ncbi:MAG: hypothetical protein HOE90_09875 [Bacteriovoracaceae bacterium]|jgi:thiamine pyrophosphokinase|nr:hypothetical protein [Bacteriovoracaceae bacterium]